MKLILNRCASGYFLNIVIALLLLLSAGVFTKISAQASQAPKNAFASFTTANFPGVTVSTQSFLGFSNKDRIIDANPSNFASWGFFLGGSSWIEVKDPRASSDPFPAGSYAGFVIDNKSLSIVSVMTVTTYLNGAEQDKKNGADLITLASFISGTGRIGFISSKPFDAVRFTASAFGVVGGISVYNAEVKKAEPSKPLNCNEKTVANNPDFGTNINYSNTGVFGVCVGCSVSDPENVISASNTDYATISMPVSVIGVGRLGVKDYTKSYPKGTYAGFNISSPTFVDVNVISGMSLILYKDGKEVQRSTSADFASVGVFLLNGDGTQTIGVIAKQDFDEVVLEVGSLASVLRTLRVYGAVLQEFCEPQLACNTLTNFTAPKYPAYIDYANTAINSLACVGCQINNTQNIIDNDPTNYASINLTTGVAAQASVAVGNGYAASEAIRPGKNFPKGTFAGFDVETGVLLTADVIKWITIDLLDDGKVVQSGTGTGLGVGVNSSFLQGRTRQVVGVVGNVPFDEVKISFNQLVSVNFGEIRLFNAVFMKPCTTQLECNTSYFISQPKFGAVIDGGLTGLQGVVQTFGYVQDPWNIVDADQTNFAKINIPISVGQTGSIAVVDGANTFPAGTMAGFSFRDNNFLVSTAVINTLTITTYNDGVQQESKTGVDLLDLTAIIDLIGRGRGMHNIGFVTTKPWDEARLTVAALATAGLSQNIDVFGAFVDTRYATGGGPGCEVVEIRPDINATFINVPVTGSVATNDVVLPGTTYGTPQPTTGAGGKTNPSGATITMNSNGTYTFNATQVGVYNYLVPVCGSNGKCVNSLLTITVTDPAVPGTGGNNSPVVNTDYAATNAGTPVNVVVKANDAAIGKGALLGTPKISEAPKNGTASVNSDGSVKYTPNPGFVGNDTLTYQVCQTPDNTCGVAYVIVMVKPAAYNTTTAADDYAYTKQGVAVSGNVKTNDTDPEGNTQTVTTQSITNATGKFDLRSDGSYTYTPAPDYTGTAQFVYTTCDNGTPKACASATLYVSVAPGTQGSTNPDVLVTFTNTPTTASVATNDKMPTGTTYGTPIPVKGTNGLNNPSGATINMNSDGTYTFTATKPGVYTYEVPVCTPAPNAVCKNENLTITVLEKEGKTNNPTANTDIASTKVNTPVTYPVLANDAPGNLSGDLGAPTIVTQPVNGSATVNSNRTVTYTPKQGFVGKDSLLYKVCENPGGLCATAYMYIYVNAAGAANTTLAADDYVHTWMGKPAIGNVKTNDTDPEGNTQTVTAQTITNANGTLVLKTDGSFVFTPTATFTGAVQFPYKTCDNGTPQACANATLYITVSPIFPDLTPSIIISPSQVDGKQTLDVRIGVKELANVITNGSPVYVTIAVSPNFKLDTFNPLLQSIAGQPIINANWTYMGIVNKNHLFKLGGLNNLPVINASMILYFGFSITFDAINSAGAERVNVSIVDESGGDNNSSNNRAYFDIQFNNK